MAYCANSDHTFTSRLAVPKRVHNNRHLIAEASCARAEEPVHEKLVYDGPSYPVEHAKLSNKLDLIFSTEGRNYPRKTFGSFFFPSFQFDDFARQRVVTTPNEMNDAAYAPAEVIWKIDVKKLTRFIVSLSPSAK